MTNVTSSRRSVTLITGACFAIIAIGTTLAGETTVGASPAEIATSCTMPTGEAVEYGLSTISTPTKEQLTEGSVPLAMAADASSTTSAISGAAVHTSVDMTVDMATVAETMLETKVKPGVVDGGFPTLAPSAFLNVEISNLVARFPVPEGLTLSGAPTASSTGPAVTAAVVGDIIELRITSFRVGTYGVPPIQGGTTSTTLAPFSAFTVSLDAHATVDAGIAAGTTIDLQPGVISYDLDSQVGVYFFGALVTGGVRGPHTCNPVDPNQVLARTTVLAGGATTTAQNRSSTTAGPTTSTTAHRHSTTTSTLTATITAQGATTTTSTPNAGMAISPTTVDPGGSLIVASDGWQMGTNVTATIHSDPVLLGSRVADVGGEIAATFVVPASVVPGAHHVQLAGTGTDGLPRLLRTPLRVAGVPASTTAANPTASTSGGGSTSSGTLPAAGSDTWFRLAMALVLFLAGLAVLSTSVGTAGLDGELEPHETTAATAGIWIVAAASFGAGVLHLAYAPSHLADQTSHGVFFLVVGWLQIGLALLVGTRKAGITALILGALVNLAVLAVWAGSRSIGIDGTVEAIGFPDALASGLALTAVLGCIALASHRLDSVRIHAATAGVWGGAAAMAVVILVTASMTPATGGGHRHGGAELASAHGEAAHGHGHGHSDANVDEDGNVVVSAGHDDSHDDSHGDDSSTQTALGSTGHADHERASGSSASSSGGSSAPDDHGAHAATSSAANLTATTTTTVHDHGTTTTPGQTTPGPTTSTTVHDHGTTTTTAPSVVADWRMGATDAQVADTRAFVAATQAAVATFTSFQDAEAKGYVKIGDDHMLKVSYMLDGKVTDPSAIESLIIGRRGGVDVILGGMYMLNIGQDDADAPTFGGPLVVWHRHGGFCHDENLTIVGSVDPITGECPPGTMFINDPPMTHIWSQPISDAGTVRTESRCGTFVYLDVPHDGTVPGCTDGGHEH